MGVCPYRQKSDFLSEINMAVKTCRECKKEFEYVKSSRYPRKYCDKCAAQRRKDYEKIDEITADQCEEE